VLFAAIRAAVTPVVADAIWEVAAEASNNPEGWPRTGDALIARLRTELDLLHLAHKREELDAAERALCAWGDARVESGEPFRILDFLDWHSGRHVVEQAAEAEQADRVILTTIHGAKGLEWRGVWVLGCEEGKLPRAEKAPDPDAPSESMEEQRRSFYVALTRGMDRVRLCWSRHRSRSRFVEEALGPLPTEPEAVPYDPDADDLPIF
jgi:superfamily I DNA/RNA helicase